MADWTLPQLSDLKVDVLNMLKLRDVDAITLAEDPISKVTGSIRWWRAQSKFQSWNGTAWVDLVISHGGGGTGATNPGDILAGLGLGTMSTQNSNAVNITGGSITGLSALGTAGNLTVGGVITAGSGPTTITNSAGQILESAIADGTVYPRIAANEYITGSWAFATPVYAPSFQTQSLSPAVGFYQTDGAANQKFTQWLADANIFELRFYKDDMSSYTSPLTWTRNDYVVGYCSAQGPWVFAGGNVQIGAGAGGYIYFYGDVDQQRGIAFGTTPTNMGRIVSVSGIIHYDEDIHLFRTRAGTEAAKITTGEMWTTGSIRPLNGAWVYPDASGTAIGVGGGSITMFGNTYSFINKANSVAYAYFYSTKIDFHLDVNLPGANQSLTVGGTRGNGICISKNSSASATFYTHGAGGETNFYDCSGTYRSLMYNNDTVSVIAPKFIVQAGTAAVPSITFAGYINSGMYYNETYRFGGAENCVEFGCNFNLNGGTRNVVRCHATQLKIDFLVGDNFAMSMDGGNVDIGVSTHHNLRVRGETFPIVHHGYWCGLTNQSFYQVCGVSFTSTSDIRQKDVHGPITNVLDVIDDVGVFIASFKEEFRPESLKYYPHWRQRFPSFSAQELKAKIDDKWGTRITDDSSPDNLAITPDRLIPVLWQAVKELHARLKALEP